MEPSPPRGQQFDATSEPASPPSASPKANPRPFLGIQFSCCRTYARVYRSELRTCYEGHCPRCGRIVRVPIGPGGTGKRFFTAGDG